MILVHRADEDRKASPAASIPPPKRQSNRVANELKRKKRIGKKEQRINGKKWRN
jgi:hypothetical protein